MPGDLAADARQESCGPLAEAVVNADVYLVVGEGGDFG
jgi:hypothetical protein